MKKKFHPVAILIMLVLVWGCICLSDYGKIQSFQIPAFSVCSQSTAAPDAVSYQGLGYRAELKGDFSGGVDSNSIESYKYYLFGKLMAENTKK